MTEQNRQFLDTVVEKLNAECNAEIKISSQYGSVGIETATGWYNIDGYNTLGMLRIIAKATDYIQ